MYQILIVGDSGVGKSCLLHRFADDAFSEGYISTIGVDFRVRTLHLDEKKIKMQIWDTAGQERFRNIVASYYRGAHGIILVYDICNANTFTNLKRWLTEIAQHSYENVDRLIIGNKCDQENRRAISYDTARRFADSNDVSYMETSAKNSTNVEQMFITMAKNIKNRLGSQLMISASAETIVIRPGSTSFAVGKEKSSCCSR